jgi:hypothetical protein
MARKRYDVLDGPSKLDLMLALFDGEFGERRLVELIFRDPQNAPEGLDPGIFIVINGVAREGSGTDTWLFNGFLESHPVRGFFSSQIRKGWIEMPEGARNLDYEQAIRRYTRWDYRFMTTSTHWGTAQGIQEAEKRGWIIIEKRRFEVCGGTCTCGGKGHDQFALLKMGKGRNLTVI